MHSRDGNMPKGRRVRVLPRGNDQMPLCFLVRVSARSNRDPAIFERRRASRRSSRLASFVGASSMWAPFMPAKPAVECGSSSYRLPPLNHTAGAAPMHRGAPRTRATSLSARPIRGLSWLLKGRRHKRRCRRHPRRGSAENAQLRAACGITETARQKEEFINNEAREGEVSEKSIRDEAVAGWQVAVRGVSGTSGRRWMEAGTDGSRTRRCVVYFRRQKCPKGYPGWKERVYAVESPRFSDWNYCCRF